MTHMPGSVFTHQRIKCWDYLEKSRETLDQIFSSWGKTLVVLAATTLGQLDKTVELAAEKKEAWAVVV